MPRTGVLSEAQARYVLEQVGVGRMQKDLAAELGVSAMVVSNIVRGNTYAHLQGLAQGRREGATTRHGMQTGKCRRRLMHGRFWAQVDRSAGPDMCWPFRGAVGSAYGSVHIGLSGTRLSHVVAYTLAHGLEAAPSNEWVIRHLCSYKPCCNPAHLRLGTKPENYQDFAKVREAGLTPPVPVDEPVTPPDGGWHIVEDDLDRLERLAREEEFWAQVERPSQDSCWLWTGRTRHKFGYGQMAFDGRHAVPAHRISWAIAHGYQLDDMPRHIHIRHLCPGGANAQCVNPRHLAEGSAADNRADAVRDGRVPHGERHHNVTLSDVQVKAARERYFANETVTAAEIAEELGTTIATVCRWLKGQARKAAGGPVGPVRRIDPPH